jgi:hypothetical protein
MVAKKIRRDPATPLPANLLQKSAPGKGKVQAGSRLVRRRLSAHDDGALPQKLLTTMRRTGESAGAVGGQEKTYVILLYCGAQKTALY